MGRDHKQNRSTSGGPRRRQTAARLLGAIAFLAIVAYVSNRRHGIDRTADAPPLPTNSSSRIVTDTAIPTNSVAQSLMVTVELDFGGPPPGIAAALSDIERRYEPADGIGRTFSVLDAYGGPTANGKLHISMHISLEKPGIGALVFRRTGEVLWKSRIVANGAAPPAQKNLTIIMDDDAGHSVMLDGSKGAARVLDVPLRDSTARVRDAWPDGAEREFTFIYSVCGCPVKARVRRIRETTTRTSGLPVMFPDDPEAMQVINALMGWSK